MKSDLVIQFSGLKEGLHDFNFEIGDAFFEQLDYTDIDRADLKVALRLEKKTNMLILNFEIDGKVEVMCDKCTDLFFTPINTSEELIYKFGEGVSDDEKIVMLPEHETEVDVSQPIYELSCLALPSRNVHPEGECNQEMLDTMDNYLMVEKEEDEEPSDEEHVDDENIDPRWSDLLKLKK